MTSSVPYWIKPCLQVCLTAGLVLTACQAQTPPATNVSASPKPTSSPSNTPATALPTPQPTPQPTPLPTPLPSAQLSPPTPSGSPTAPPPKPTATPKPTPKPTPMPTIQPAPMPSGSPTVSPQPSPTATGSGVISQEDISLTTGGFGPDSVIVKKGSTVTWTNLSQTQKTLHSDQDLFPDTPLPGRGSSFTYVFDIAGTYTFNNGTVAYVCTVTVNP